VPLSIKFNSPVILSYASICSLVFFFEKLFGFSVMSMFTFLNDTNFANPINIFRFVSHIAGHVNLEHLMGNMTFILLLGPIIEERYGSRQTLFMILVTAILTAILNLMFFNTGLIGASGIVFLLIVLVSFTNVKSGEIPVTFILVAILFVGKELLNSIWQDHVSQFAHIMGGICGGIFGFLGKGK
jgi:membrane associated rhomboid family serine protease